MYTFERESNILYVENEKKTSLQFNDIVACLVYKIYRINVLRDITLWTLNYLP